MRTKQRGIPPSQQPPNRNGDTDFGMYYLPQFITPQRRQIHGLFVDLQAK